MRGMFGQVATRSKEGQATVSNSGKEIWQTTEKSLRPQRIRKQKATAKARRTKERQGDIKMFYYTARQVINNNWIGIVYHLENNKEKYDYVSQLVHTEKAARDLAYKEWLHWQQPQGILKSRKNK